MAGSHPIPADPATAAPPTSNGHGGLAQDARLLIGAAWRLSPRQLIGQLVLLLLVGLVGGASLLLLIPIVNSVANPGQRFSVPALGDLSLAGFPLWELLAAFVVLTAAQALITRSSAVNSMAMQQVLVDRLRQQAFDAILAARWSFVLQRRRSDIIEIVTTGAARSGLAFSQLLQLAVTGVLAVATAVVALLVAPVVAAVSIVGVVVLGLALSTAIRPAHRLGRDFGERNRHLQSVMANSMDSLRLVRAHNASATWTQQLAEAFTGAREVQLANIRRSSTVSAWSSVGLALAASMLVLLAVWAKVPPTSIVVILVLVARLATQVQKLATTGTLLANLLPAVRDLTRLTSEARAEAEQPPGAEVASGVTEDVGATTDLRGSLIAFRDVTFSYPNSDNGVEGVTFTVPRGDITVLTGPSGSGKSTIVDLALGLLTPDRGEIVVDGRPLGAGDLRRWRDSVAYVPQETVLIPGTLRQNLVWSVSGQEPDDEACWRALDRAAAAFARTLPDGLDTMVGDRGVRLSGGERQRVAIARALLREPSLLVLDEATSSLDDDTEAAVLEVLASLVPAVTMLVVAHRRTTVDAADHIVRIRAGAVFA